MKADFWGLVHCRYVSIRPWTTIAFIDASVSLLPGKSHGWGSLVDCGPWGCEESDTTEWLNFDFSLSCIGEGNGNPLQCSCLENPRDGGAWWAAVYGVAQSRTRLKWFRSSSTAARVYRNIIWANMLFYFFNYFLFKKILFIFLLKYCLFTMLC